MSRRAVAGPHSVSGVDTLSDLKYSGDIKRG